MKNMTTQHPTFDQWIESCPVAWNIEYSEDWDRFCYFFREPGEDEEEFLESFRGN
jgi:hypothetical protein